MGKRSRPAWKDLLLEYNGKGKSQHETEDNKVEKKIKTCTITAELKDWQ